MGDTKPYLRLATFAGVLILVGGLMVGLFQEASAVEMAWDDAPTTVTGSTTFTMDVHVPNGQRLPIETIEVVIEQENPNNPGTKIDPSIVTRAECRYDATPGSECSGASLTTSGSKSDAVSSITFVNAFKGQPANGYTLEESDFSEDTGYSFTGTGYGYDVLSPQWQAGTGSQGYGYGYSSEFANSYSGSGYSYGYNDDLFLRFEVTIDGGNLDTGTHWATFLTKIDSDVVPDQHSPFTEFNVQRSSGSPGGGGGGGAADGRLDVGVGDTFDGDDGQKIRVTSGLPDGLQELQIELAMDCNDCSIQVTRSSSGSSGAENRGFTPIYFLTIEVLDDEGDVIDGAVAEGYLLFNVGQDELPGNSQAPSVTLLRNAQGWTPLSTTLDSASDADPLVYNGTLPGFSEFAVAADTQGPTISDGSPTGITQQVTPTISASWDDNREVNPNSLVLTIDDVRHSSTRGDMSRTTDGFTYVPGTALSLGMHEVSATVKDISGVETTETWTFQITSVDCPTPPRITSVQPSDGATDVALDATITVTVQEGDCAIENTRLTIDGQEVTATYANGQLTATLSGVDTGETVDARAQVTDTGGNNAAQSWSFTTTEEEVTPPEDGGIPGWVWVIIVLLVIAAAVGGWYYYDQQQQ